MQPAPDVIFCSKRVTLPGKSRGRGRNSGRMEDNMEDDILVLTDETGAKISFEILDIVEYNGEEYAVLYPADAGEDEPVHILRIHSEDMDNGEVEYEGLDDEKLINKVYRVFCRKNGI